MCDVRWLVVVTLLMAAPTASAQYTGTTGTTGSSGTTTGGTTTGGSATGGTTTGTTTGTGRATGTATDPCATGATSTFTGTGTAPTGTENCDTGGYVDGQTASELAGEKGGCDSDGCAVVTGQSTLFALLLTAGVIATRRR